MGAFGMENAPFFAKALYEIMMLSVIVLDNPAASVASVNSQ
jgi:hypothetical protein